jgi:hypothetical protein
MLMFALGFIACLVVIRLDRWLMADDDRIDNGHHGS